MFPTIRLFHAFLITVLALGALAAITLSRHRVREQELQARYEVDFANRGAALKKAAAERRDRQVEEQAREWMEALGGPKGMRLRDPHLSLLEFIRENAVGCCPANARIEVTVDRFVEFHVDVHLSSDLTEREMAERTACLLGSTATYVHQVTWWRSRERKGEIDRRIIESVATWEPPGADGIAALQEQIADRREPVEVATVSTNDLPLAWDDSPQGRALQRTWDAFDARRVELNSLIARSQAAAQVTLVQSTSELYQRRQALREGGRQLGKVLEFYRQPAPAVEPLLEGAHPVVARATLREMSNRSTLAVDLAEAGVAFAQAQERFLQGLTASWGNWKVLPDGEHFGFSDEVTAAEFKRLQAEVVLVKERLEKAVGVWSEAMEKRAGEFQKARNGGKEVPRSP